MAELGALSLRIEEQGGTAVLAKLQQVDAAAKLTSVSVDTAAKALNRLGIAAKVSAGQIVVAETEVTRATGIVRQLGSAAVVTSGQVEQTGQRVERMGQRVAVAGDSAARMSPKIRSGASAVAALAIAATSGGGSLAGMATQAGLVGSVMAAEFAPAKWAGYAAGIGAVVIGIAALVGIMSKLRAEQAKPSPLSLQRIEDIKQLTIAEDEYTKHRNENARLEAEIAASDPRAFRTPTEQSQELTRLSKLNAALKKSRELEAAANKKTQELRNTATIEGAEVAKDAIITAAENTRTVRLSELAKEQAASSAAFAAGTRSLQVDYEKRRATIIEQEQLERDVLEKTRAQKLKPVAGETEQAGQGRRIEAGAITAEISALAAETQAKLTALDAQRVADEKALVAKILAYEAQIEAVRDESFVKRQEQIAAEAEERRKLVFQQTGDAQQAADAAAALSTEKTNQLVLATLQSRIEHELLALDTRRQAIATALAAGKIEAADASRQVATEEKAAEDTLRNLVDLAHQFAAALGDQGALASLTQRRGELGALGIDAAAVAQHRQIAEQAGSAVANAFSSGFGRGLGEGGTATVARAMKAFFADLLGGVGGIFNQLLAEQITGGILRATAAASVAGIAATTAATAASAATAGAAATIAEVSAARAQAAAATAAAAAGSAAVASGAGGAAGVAGAATTGNPWILAGAIAFSALSALLGRRSEKPADPASPWQPARSPWQVERLILDPNSREWADAYRYWHDVSWTDTKTGRYHHPGAGRESPTSGIQQRIGSAGQMTAAPAPAAGQVMQVIGINTPRGQELIGLSNASYQRRRS